MARFNFDISSATTTHIVADSDVPAGVKIRVLGWKVTGEGNNHVTLQDTSGSPVILDDCCVVAGGGQVLPPSNDWDMDTTDSEGLDLVTSTSARVTGFVLYRTVR